jgi:hypothetical protein
MSDEGVPPDFDDLTDLPEDCDFERLLAMLADAKISHT